MGKKIDRHPDYPQQGPLYERVFHGAVLDDRLRRCLETFKERELIVDFRVEAEGLKLWRPWVEGETLLDFVKERTAVESVTLPRDLFRIVLGQLRTFHEMGYGHGALHPNNVIVAKDEGPRVLDPFFNKPHLTPQEADSEGVWLWGPGVPRGWSLEAWDQVCLLRMATLLAQGPAAKKEPLPEEVVELCHGWAAQVIESLDPGADLIPKLRAAEAHVDHILDAVVKPEPPQPEPPPSYPIEEELEELKARRGDRVLRTADERGLKKRAGDARIHSDEIRERIEVWILQNGFRREEELKEMAWGFIKAGRPDSSTKLIGRRACAAAERVFTFYGVERGEAEDRVRSVLDGFEFLDERQEAPKCQQYVDGYLAERGLTQVGTEHAKELIAGLVEKHRQPLSVAKRLVLLDLERRWLRT